MRRRSADRLDPPTPVEPGPVIESLVVETCLAPGTNLRFEPDGSVVACCVNTRFSLGHVSRTTIREIWDGAPVRELGEALAAGDYSLGCQECASEIEIGNRDATYARTFDRFATTASPTWPRRLEFAISNRCNLMCVQCTGELSSAIRRHREHRPPLENHYGEAFFDELPPFLAEAESTVFLGGEPFLQPEAWRIWDLLLAMDPAQRPTVDVTTNGTRWNERIERYVRELVMTVAVSVDSVDAELGEAIRVGSDHREVLANLHRLRSVTREAGGGFGINMCLMRENWSELPALLALGDEVDGDVEVIIITYPHDHSLLLLPPSELGLVIEQLEARDDEMQATLTRNLHRWDAALRRLRFYAEGAVSVPVEISVRRAESMDPERVRSILAQLEVERDRLAASSGVEPFEVIATDGTVEDVVDRPWAKELEVVSWIGCGVDAMVALIGERLGSTPSIDPVHLGPDLLRVDLSVAHRRFEVVVVEWIEDGHCHLRALGSEMST